MQDGCASSRRSILLSVLALATWPSLGETAAGETFEMQVGGKPWKASRSIVARTVVGDAAAWNINGFLDGPKVSRVGFLIYPPSEAIPAGTFALGQAVGAGTRTNSGSFNLDLAGGNLVEDDYRFGSGQLTLTAYDAARRVLSGTFSATGRNASGTVIEITAGRFTDVGFAA